MVIFENVCTVTYETGGGGGVMRFLIDASQIPPAPHPPS